MKKEPPAYIVTRQVLRPSTVARIQASYDRFGVVAGTTPATISHYSIGGVHYSKEAGTWYRIVRRRNPAYWDQPRYFVIAGTIVDAWEMVFCQCPRRITTRAWRRGVKAIVRAIAGQAVPWQNFIVEAVDARTFQARSTGKKPELAYTMKLDGSFARVRPGKRQNKRHER